MEEISWLWLEVFLKHEEGGRREGHTLTKVFFAEVEEE